MRTLSCFLSFLFIPLFSHADDLDSVIERARAFVATDDLLNGIERLKYEGTIIPASGQDERRVVLYLEKPNRQRLEIFDDVGKVSLVVNGREGFMIQEDLQSGQSRISLLPTDQIRRFTANAVENLYYYKFPPRAQVRVRYLGQEEFRGEMADVVRFIHPGNSMFLRYFEPGTGRLIATLSDTGVINLEDGHKRVDGIRFSEAVLSYQGDEYEHKIVFDNIEVNPEFDPKLFSFPE